MTGGSHSLALQLLPAGTTLPPLPYLVGVLVALAAVVLGLVRRGPGVTDRTVLAFAPWMALGATLYALYQYPGDVYPEVVAPLASSPTVYLTTAVLAGLVWITVADRPVDSMLPPAAPGVVATVGAACLIVALGIALVVGLREPPLVVLVPGGALVASFVLGAVVWLVVGEIRPFVVRAAGYGGLVVVVGHTLDGLSTAVGIELLGFGEQTPLSRLIIEFSAANLPSVPLLGAAWLFVVVKIALATAVVWVLAESVDEDPVWGNLVMTLVAAVGLGPGVHNVVLFAIAG